MNDPLDYEPASDVDETVTIWDAVRIGVKLVISVILVGAVLALLAFAFFYACRGTFSSFA